MGFHYAGATFPLRFTAGPFAGLEADCRAGSAGQYKTIAALGDDGLPPDEVYERLCRALAGSLERWNVEDKNGVPVPPTYDGLMSQDIDLINALAQEWLDAVLARKRAETASEEDREMAAALAEFGHETLPDGNLASNTNL